MTKTGEPQRVPDAKPPKKRRSAASRVVASLFGLALLGALAAGGAAFYAYQEFSLPGPLTESKIVDIGKGKGAPEIATELQDAGVITDARIFSVMAYATGNRSRLKAGEYEFPKQASMRDVLALIASGKSISYKVSIPEGWTSEMAMARLLANEVLTGEITTPPAEGAILPDTYVFKRGMTRQKLIDDMQAAQTKLLDEIWTTRSTAVNLKTAQDLVILASIVEKETGIAEERPIIASVFLNRLEKNMRLQSDPTIIYGIVGGKGKLDRPLTRSDIRTPTPYNTYTINGLPPGPIANPGKAALEAVANPPSTDYLYFVADGSGGHAFAATLEDHNRNVAKWRELGKGEVSAGAEDAAPAEKAPETVPPAAEATTAPAQPDGSQPLPAIESTQAPAPVPAAPVAETPADPASPAPVPAVAESAEPPPAAPAPEASVVEAPVAEAPAKPAAETPAPAAETAPSKTPEPIVKPVAKPLIKPVAKPEVAAEAPTALPPQPGSIVKVDGKLVAIPKRKPKR